MTADPGERPRSPCSVELPVLVTVEPASTEYDPAVPKTTLDTEPAKADGEAIVTKAPTTIALAPAVSTGQRAFRLISAIAFFNLMT